MGYSDTFETKTFRSIEGWEIEIGLAKGTNRLDIRTNDGRCHIRAGITFDTETAEAMAAHLVMLSKF